MAQFARPSSDVSAGSWTPSTGTTLWETLDETSASDSDFVRSENDPSGSAAEVGLSSVTDPSVSTGHVARYRYQKGESGGGSPADIDLIVRLRQGTTTIASQTHLDIATGFVAGTFTLDGAEADAITDYSLLRAQFEADKSAGARTSWAEVSWLELEVPDAASTDRTAQISAFELETPDAARAARVSAYELEAPSAPRAARVSAYELETPDAARVARISAFELEVPEAPTDRKARVSAYELETPDAPRRVQISAFELETEDATDRTARISAFELESPDAGRAARVSAYELETPDAARAARVSAYELEALDAPRRARVSAFELGVLGATGRRPTRASAFGIGIGMRS
jgi:hypothetical protein